MKNLIIKISKAGPLLFLALSFVGAKAQLQVENFSYSIANKVLVSPKQLEFDLILLDLDNTLPFEIATVQAGITMNPAFTNGGIVTASIVPGSSTLSNSAQWPTSIACETGTSTFVKLASKVPPGAGFGSVMSTDPLRPTRLCRIRLINTSDWARNSSADLALCLNKALYPTKISEYISGINVPVEIRSILDSKSASIDPENSLSNIKVYSDLQTVVINNSSDLTGEIWIYDLSGHELLHTSMTSRDETRIPLQVATGTYLVKVVTENGVISNKVFIR